MPSGSAYLEATEERRPKHVASWTSGCRPRRLSCTRRVPLGCLAWQYMTRRCNLAGSSCPFALDDERWAVQDYRVFVSGSFLDVVAAWVAFRGTASTIPSSSLALSALSNFSATRLSGVCQGGGGVRFIIRSFPFPFHQSGLKVSFFWWRRLTRILCCTRLFIVAIAVLKQREEALCRQSRRRPVRY